LGFNPRAAVRPDGCGRLVLRVGNVGRDELVGPCRFLYLPSASSGSLRYGLIFRSRNEREPVPLEGSVAWVDRAGVEPRIRIGGSSPASVGAKLADSPYESLSDAEGAGPRRPDRL
jgi:hypothetical protein